ncbi:MAG: hypothetical protein HQ472_00125 [Ignavibacteria bacterium]|nr:hypothetical protein [Ignavibacteria bacterium]
MISREQLVASIQNEIRVCRHVATKLNPADSEYRPTDEQRTTIELMRYLAVCGIGTLEALVNGNWDSYDAREERAKAMQFADFDAAMETQDAEIVSAFSNITDVDLVSKLVKAPGVGEVPLGLALMRTVYAWFVAYRHELFVRAKICGNSEINTSNNWGGKDRKKVS